jgi:hypothetical protein
MLFFFRLRFGVGGGRVSVVGGDLGEGFAEGVGGGGRVESAAVGVGADAAPGTVLGSAGPTVAATIRRRPIITGTATSKKATTAHVTMISGAFELFRGGVGGGAGQRGSTYPGGSYGGCDIVSSIDRRQFFLRRRDSWFGALTKVSG